MDKLNWFSIVAIIILLMILCVLWIIKEVLESKKETDAAIIRNSRRFRQFVSQDYLFRKSQRRVNQEMIKELKTTYSEYESTEELREELLGLKINIKEEKNEIGLIFTVMLTLLLSLFLVVSAKSSAILLIPIMLIIGAIASYLRMLFEKLKMKETKPIILIYTLPVILTFISIMILGIMFVTRSTPADLIQIEWLFKVIVIEGIVLYLVQLYESLKFINYLKVVIIVLNEMIMEEDRKYWKK